MKKYLVLLLLVIVSSSIYAQKQQDVLYLKNGSIIRGNVIETIPNESIKIKTKDGSLFVYKMDEVSKVEREEKVTTTINNPGPKRGYVGFFDVSYGLPLGDSYGGLYVKTTHGYQFNPYLFAGIGGGYDGCEGNIPIYADVRGTFDKKISPYADFKLGVNAANGQIYLSPTLGCRFRIAKRQAINVGVSFDFTRQTHYYSYPTSEYNSLLKKYTTKYNYYQEMEGNNIICFGVSYEF